MTVLSAAQDAAQLLVGYQPASLFTTDEVGRELGRLATTAARAIGKYHEWQKLKILKSYAGDGVTTAFDLPPDYGRMLKKGAVHSSTWKNANYRPVRDEDEWLFLQETNISGTPGVWILLGGQIQFFPPPPVSETPRHYYISKNVVALSDSVPATKDRFTLDSDVFVLSEELLTLALMWRWRSLKRMDYSEDLANYEIALAEAVTADKAAKPLVVGRQRVPSGAVMAFPGTIVP
jgi:hypothetical protein